ncbi:MAG: glutathione synthetase [Proteobacteria bacterium]|nr:glutathione synthetase [Pseudomonadota bacterium]
MIELIGYIGAFLTTTSFLPQAIKTIKTRDTSGISLVMYLMFVTGVCFWLAYGFLIHSQILIISNSIVFFLSGIILCVKIYNNFKQKIL